MSTRNCCTGSTLGVVFAALMFLQGCAETVIAVGAGAAVMSYTDRRSTGAQVDDEGIELRVANRIDERFGDKLHINVTSFNYVVLLTGEVPDAGTRAEVEKIARGAAGVRSVANETQVAGVSSFGARTNDSYITSKVKARFLDVGHFNPNHVKVVTEASVVYLMGIVSEAEAKEAVEIARTTGGVLKVVKIFEYCTPGQAPCKAPEKAS
ncbi:MAG TPA: BON domain-containing protein [Burkholderiales bacterium]|nr:BON domain-containing protein [Burkholderiales bacterium]